MGLFSDKHFHSHDNRSYLNFPDTLKVEEKKAPTDESIRLLNEFQEKALDNLIAKVEVKDNLVTGTVMAFEMARTTAAIQYEIMIICKFKINGNEFVVEHGISRSELWKDNADRSIMHLNETLKNYVNSVMLWFMLKQFVAVAFKQITNTNPPDYHLRNLF